MLYFWSQPSCKSNTTRMSRTSARASVPVDRFVDVRNAEWRNFALRVTPLRDGQGTSIYRCL